MAERAIILKIPPTQCAFEAGCGEMNCAMGGWVLHSMLQQCVWSEPEDFGPRCCLHSVTSQLSGLRRYGYSLNLDLAEDLRDDLVRHEFLCDRRPDPCVMSHEPCVPNLAS